MILLIDNYDSFVYNLYQYFCMLGEDIEVYRNDKITIAEIQKKSPKAIVISPGPCTPNEAGISLDIVMQLYKQYPILGVCLGHQVVAQAFGGSVIRAKQIMHGKTAPVQHTNTGIFYGADNPLTAMRYHSLVVSDLPEELVVTARSTDDDEIMGIRHTSYFVEGIQFHPESILTHTGLSLLKQFINEVDAL